MVNQRLYAYCCVYTIRPMDRSASMAVISAHWIPKSCTNILVLFCKRHPFADTIEENIDFGRRFSKEQIEEAAARAQAKENLSSSCHNNWPMNFMRKEAI